MKVCKSCGATEHLHRGLCRGCRKRLQGDPSFLKEERDEPRPREPEIEPPHDRPWVHQGGA